MWSNTFKYLIARRQIEKYDHLILTILSFCKSRNNYIIIEKNESYCKSSIVLYTIVEILLIFITIHDTQKCDIILLFDKVSKYIIEEQNANKHNNFIS